MARKTVLLIDDEKVVVNLGKEYIERKDGDRYIVETAYNGEEALKILERRDVDLIVLDLNMPVMNGYQFLEEVKKRGIDVPIIILTGNMVKNAKLEFAQFNVVEYVEKPINIKELRNKIVSILG